MNDRKRKQIKITLISLFQTHFQIITKYPGMIVHGFFRCIEECHHRMRLYKSQEIRYGRRSVQLFRIQDGEVIPMPRYIFVKPLAQGGGRCYIFCPIVIFQPFFFLCRAAIAYLPIPDIRLSPKNPRTLALS